MKNFDEWHSEKFGDLGTKLPNGNYSSWVRQFRYEVWKEFETELQMYDAIKKAQRDQIELLKEQNRLLRQKVGHVFVPTDPSVEDSMAFSSALFRRISKFSDGKLPKELIDLKLEPIFVQASLSVALHYFVLNAKERDL